MGLIVVVEEVIDVSVEVVVLALVAGGDAGSHAITVNNPRMIPSFMIKDFIVSPSVKKTYTTFHPLSLG